MEVVTYVKTKQIIFTKPYVAELLDAECLPPKEYEVSVSLEYSAISSGTEKANLIGMRNGIFWAEVGAWYGGAATQALGYFLQMRKRQLRM